MLAIWIERRLVLDQENVGTGSWPAAGALWVGQLSLEKWSPSGTGPLGSGLAGCKSPIGKDDRGGSISQSRRLGLHLLLVDLALRRLC